MEIFTKESIAQAVHRINENPSLIKGRESKDYDLIMENGKTYPPILVLSEANKILGGEAISLSDFNNNTRRAFDILRNFGFNVIKKRDTSLSPVKFDYQKFLRACSAANLHISENLAIRFISSLLTKPFVVLTGLSGSGKTKLALAFAKWLTNESSKTATKIFSLGDEIKSNRVSYIVTATDKVAVTFTQVESGTKATLPYELINEWIEKIFENKFSQQTSTRVIRETVERTTKYSTQLNSFETHLKAAAFHLISIDSKPAIDLHSNRLCIIPVGADWTNREPLLGYPNALETGKYVQPENGALQLIIEAINDPDNPYFLILDEMNLSHVERYFADFLSAMESSEDIPLHSESIEWKDNTPAKIILPKNLFIIGTVNIDETTYMFSPKVLDRANVIEFRVNTEDMKAYLSKSAILDFKYLNAGGADMAISFVAIAKDKSLIENNASELQNGLIVFFEQLKKVGAEFGYRSASEILRFSAIVNKIEPSYDITRIMDAAIMQKLLPKVHGSRRKLEPILKTLGSICLTPGQEFDSFLSPKSEIDFTDTSKVKYPISLEKILRMFNSLISNGFTSYAEA